jgi:hypothetical protein
MYIRCISKYREHMHPCSKTPLPLRIAFSTKLYLYSMLERETVDRFLDDHAMMLPP